MQAEEAGEAAARAAGTRWNGARDMLLRAGAPEGDTLTDELLLYLYFTDHAAIHIALFDQAKVRNRVQMAYSLAWDAFARSKSHTVNRLSDDRLQAYSRSLQESRGTGSTASAVADVFSGFLGCENEQVTRVSALLFDEQMTATMSLIREQRRQGLR
jgi:hypothetical protein